MAVCRILGILKELLKNSWRILKESIRKKIVEPTEHLNRTTRVIAVNEIENDLRQLQHGAAAACVLLVIKWYVGSLLIAIWLQPRLPTVSWNGFYVDNSCETKVMFPPILSDFSIQNMFQISSAFTYVGSSLVGQLRVETGFT